VNRAGGPAVWADGLVKHYDGRDGNVEAVRGVDLEVQPGAIFGFLGPNGAGKSTTVGYDRAPSGSTPVELRKRYPPTPIHRTVLPAPVISSSTPTAPNQEKP
jgi:ATPase subunit of ABC transporter with duplicated ATPase domains